MREWSLLTQYSIYITIKRWWELLRRKSLKYPAKDHVCLKKQGYLKYIHKYMQTLEELDCHVNFVCQWNLIFYESNLVHFVMLKIHHCQHHNTFKGSQKWTLQQQRSACGAQSLQKMLWEADAEAYFWLKYICWSFCLPQTKHKLLLFFCLRVCVISSHILVLYEQSFCASTINHTARTTTGKSSKGP